jgi:hypothetical protein
MHSDSPREFSPVMPQAQKENGFESVAEIVDRILQAANENSKSHSKPRNLRHGQVEARNFRV